MKRSLQFMSKQGWVAAALSGTIPLLITGYLFIRDLRAGDNFLPGAFYSMVFFILIFSAFQFFVLNPAISGLEKNGLPAGAADLPPRLRVYYGAAIGMVAYLCAAGLLIGYMYFFT